MEALGGLDAEALLQLPETARKDAIIRLMRSLPRHQLSEVHSELTAYLKRDILGALPREIAFNVFMRLDTASLLTCATVNRQWNGLVNDQGLWRHMCTLARLEADASTTWADVSAQRDHLAWEARAERLAAPRGRLSLTDEGWDEDGVVVEGADAEADDVFGQGTGNEGYGGIRRVVTERVGVGGAAGSGAALASASSGWADAPGPRRPSFQLVRKPTQLPLFLLPAGTGSSPPRAGSGAALRKRESLSTLVAPTLPVMSHMPDPTPKPRPNYKHLYLLHDILAARSRTSKRAPELPRPRVLDSRSSAMAGGLDGHREGIYCLAVYNHALSIPAMGHPIGWEGQAEPQAKRVEGRRWLISGSRDKTLRLWDTQRDRVVKVYTTDGDEGHTGSVLTLHARPYVGRTGGRMVSGGSDGRVVVWDLESGEVQGTIQASVRGMSVLCVRFDERRIVCCSKDCSIRTFDARTLKPLLVIGGPTPNVGVQPENALVNNPPMTADDVEGHRAAVNAVALTDRYIISASGDRTLRAWNVDTGELLLKLEAHSRGIASLDVDVLSGIAVTGSSDWGIREFDLGQYGLDFSPLQDSSRPGTPDDSMAALDVEDDDDEDDIMAGHPRPLEKRVTPTIFDGGLEFRAGRGCCVVTRARLEMANATSAGQEAPPFQSGSRPALSMCLNCGKRGHTDLVRALWLGKKVVVSGSYDSTIKVWDRQTGLLITDLADMHTGRIFCVVGDKAKVVSSGIDGRIVIWDYAVGLDTSFIRP